MANDQTNMIDWDLIKQKLEATITPEDEKRIEQWLQEDEKNKVLLEELMKRWQNKGRDQDYNAKVAYQEFRTRVEVSEPKKEMPEPPKITVPIVKIKHRWAVAASVALLLVVGWLWYANQEVTKQAPVASLTKSTPRGQKLGIQLPDGSLVKLNAESSITYPETFDNEAQRLVTLEGEAFFEVASDPSKPFTVQSGDLRTTVLGTSFNINAYPEKDQMEVTVATGEVQVRPATSNSSNDTLESVVLTPAEQAQFSIQSGQLTKRTVSLDAAITWRDGILRFEGSTLSEIVPELERWYGVTITLSDRQQDLCNLRLTFDNLSLTQALEQLQLTADITYRKVQPDGYEILGVGCKN